VFALILLTYLFLLLSGTSLTLQAAGQKIVVFSAIVCMSLQGIGAWKVAKKEKLAPKG
jgi:hypothetical protein